MALRVKELSAAGWIGHSPDGFEMIVNPEFAADDHFHVCPPALLPPAPPHHGLTYPPGVVFGARPADPDGDCELVCDPGQTVNLFVYLFGEIFLNLGSRCGHASIPPAMHACYDELVRSYRLVSYLREQGALRSLRLRYDLGDGCETGAICWEHLTLGWICFE